MQYSDISNDLNERQLEAVETSLQNVRVVAGAGSGKTRVLTYRVAYLISEMKVAPWKILAITFTNKVANEMKNRVIKICPDSQKHLMIKTFHSFAAYFLRQEIPIIGYPANFNILDEEDTTKLVKDVVSEMGYRRTDAIVSKAIAYIGKKKLKEEYPDDVVLGKEKWEDEKTCLEIYTRYEELKNKQLALDFDDLLLKTNYILENNVMIRTKWQNKIDFILIDEFQDTNDVEYRMIKFLLKPSSSLYVVGDPDQTIYTWRGANQDIILQLQKDFPDIETVILDRNYRSTQKILDSANKLISNNKFRIKKDLYTENKLGDDISVKHAVSSKSEGDYVAREIRKLVSLGHYSYSDIAVLYRSNYVSLDFETSLSGFQIPYIVYGGQKFYQRREIKDVIAYFRLLNSVKDDLAFERIINVPKRGIGETSVEALKTEANNHSLSLYEFVASEEALESSVAKRVINSLRNLITILEDTKSKITNDEEVLSKILENFIISIDYYKYLLEEDDGDERVENVKALFADLRNFLKTNPDSTFDEYLQNIALISAQDEMLDGEKVTLMTVHTAKGLEYPVVFVVKLNEGVFPHARSTTESGFKGLEEERRLAYVAMTRAKEKLYLSYSDGYSYVLGGNYFVSQFIKEAGLKTAETISNYSPYGNNFPSKKNKITFDDGPHQDGFDIDEPIRQDFSQATNGISDWQVGDIVIHQRFGRGVVIELEGDEIIKVKFDKEGIKSILGNHKSVSKGDK